MSNRKWQISRGGSKSNWSAKEIALGKKKSGNSLALQQLELGALTAGVLGSVSSRGTNILQAVWCGQKQTNKNKKENVGEKTRTFLDILKEQVYYVCLGSLRFQYLGRISSTCQTSPVFCPFFVLIPPPEDFSSLNSNPISSWKCLW